MMEEVVKVVDDEMVDEEVDVKVDEEEVGGLILYHWSQSFASQKVRLVICEKGLPCEEREVCLPLNEHNEPWFMRLNPAGEVPVLVHGHVVVCQADAIVTYLEGDVHGRRGAAAAARGGQPVPAARAALPRAARRAARRHVHARLHPAPAARQPRQPARVRHGAHSQPDHQHGRGAEAARQGAPGAARPYLGKLRRFK
ncbi:unnamed protein product, partial [Lampetra fluviatilis]